MHTTTHLESSQSHFSGIDFGKEARVRDAGSTGCRHQVVVVVVVAAYVSTRQVVAW